MKDPGVDNDGGDAPSVAPSLLVRLGMQDADAWGRFVVLYGPVIHAWCRHAGLKGEDVEDVGQEVLRAVAAGIGGFRRRGERDSFRGWLWTVTRNKLNDHWRGREGRPDAAGGTDAQRWFQEVPGEAVGSTGPTAPDEGGGLYRRALDLVRSEFADRTWRAFWGLAVDCRAAADVARELGMSPGAAYVAKSRVLRRLREELGESID
jgi:RNA polymerase sigma-70 factor, ECF subfamily